MTTMWTKVYQIWGHLGSPGRLTSFFPIVDIMSRCRDMFSQNSKSVQKKRFLLPVCQGKCPGSLDQIFQIAVISEYVSTFG